VETVAKEVQVKGIIYDNVLQCQLKLESKYHELKSKSFPECEIKIGSNNTVKLFAHQEWKWNGEKKQLEEQPQQAQFRDWVFLPVELKEGFTELPKATFASYIVSQPTGHKCILAEKEPLTLPITGSATGEPQPTGSTKVGLEEWNTKSTVAFAKGEGKQHDWDGALPYIGFTTGLTLAGEPASHFGSITTQTAAQEIAFFEGP
jgi:hypothetical protein